MPVPRHRGYKAHRVTGQQGAVEVAGEEEIAKHIGLAYYAVLYLQTHLELANPVYAVAGDYAICGVVAINKFGV